MTNKEMLEIILREFKEYKEDWEKFKEKQANVNETVVRHDEKIKGLWKIPTISAGVVGIISAIGVIVSLNV